MLNDQHWNFTEASEAQRVRARLTEYWNALHHTGPASHRERHSPLSAVRFAAVSCFTRRFSSLISISRTYIYSTVSIIVYMYSVYLQKFEYLKKSEEHLSAAGYFRCLKVVLTGSGVNHVYHVVRGLVPMYLFHFLHRECHYIH